MFAVVEKALFTDYAFTEKDAARRFFMDLQQTFIDWNDKKMDTPEFAQIRATLEEKIDAAKEK